MVNLRTICGWIANHFHLRRTRMLEEEIARLREENRALVNSILGLAGIPPMRSRSTKEDPARKRDSAFIGAGQAPPGRPKGRPDEKTAARVETNLAIAPLRRRSWQQLGRVREIEDARAARRERETDTATFPAPRNVVPRI